MNILLNNLTVINNSIIKADLLYNEQVIGYVHNSGDGSSTQYAVFHKEIETKLENYCDSLPKEIVYLNEKNIVEIKMTIEKLINSLILKDYPKLLFYIYPEF